LTGDEKDLEYYIKEVGDILGVTRSLPAIDRSPKRIVEFIFHQIVEFRKLNQVSGWLIPLSMLHLDLKDDDDDGDEAAVMDGETVAVMPSLFDDEGEEDNRDENDNNEPYFSDIDNYDDMNE
jgi:hypothetical protein